MPRPKKSREELLDEEKVKTILECLIQAEDQHEDPHKLAFSDLFSKTSISRSTLHDTLQRLREAGFVGQEKPGSPYYLKSPYNLVVHNFLRDKMDGFHRDAMLIPSRFGALYGLYPELISEDVVDEVNRLYELLDQVNEQLALVKQKQLAEIIGGFYQQVFKEKMQEANVHQSEHIFEDVIHFGLELLAKYDSTPSEEDVLRHIQQRRPKRETEGYDALPELVRRFVKLAVQFRDIFKERAGYCFQIPCFLDYFSIGEELETIIPLQMSYPPNSSPEIHPEMEYQIDVALLDSSNELTRDNMVMRVKWEKEQKLKDLAQFDEESDKELYRVTRQRLKFLEKKEEEIDSRLNEEEIKGYKKKLTERIKQEIALELSLSTAVTDISGLKSPSLEHYVRRYEDLSGLTKKGAVNNIMEELPDKLGQQKKIREALHEIVGMGSPT